MGGGRILTFLSSSEERLDIGWKVTLLWHFLPGRNSPPLFLPRSIYRNETAMSSTIITKQGHLAGSLSITKAVLSGLTQALRHTPLQLVKILKFVKCYGTPPHF
jgi:hypothetical protein